MNKLFDISQTKAEKRVEKENFFAKFTLQEKVMWYFEGYFERSVVL